MNEPRALSINQFKALFTDCQLNSELKSDFDDQVEYGKEQNLRINDLETYRKQMRIQIEDHVKERDAKIDAEHKFIGT